MKEQARWAARRIAFGAAITAGALAAAWLMPRSVETTAGAGVVVIDPGHGGADCGAVSPGGLEEAGLNLAVAKLVQAELKTLGHSSVLTREGEDALAKGKQADMAARRDIMNRGNVLAVVSIHMNEFGDCAVHGPMAFYMEGSPEGEKLASLTIARVTEAIGAPSRPANPGDYYVIRESQAPAVLVECGFLSNSSDEGLLQQPEHQKKLARGIAAGVAEYLAGES